MVRYIFFTIYITIRNIASTVKKILGDSNFKTEYKSLKYHFSFTLSGLIATLTKGSIAEKIGTMGGLTFCPVFIPEGTNKVMNDLTDEEKEHTHREKAFKELIKKLNIK